jgi:hypothetical protein
MALWVLSIANVCKLVLIVLEGWMEVASSRPAHRTEGMARNEEKSNAILNKWIAMQKGHAKGLVARKRPLSPAECSNLVDAEYWRRDAIRTISSKVMEIQNGT